MIQHALATHRQLNPYIPPSHQLQQPHGHRLLTTDEAATLVVHEIHVGWIEFRRTHLKSDLMLVLSRALYLQKLGYQLILDKRHDCIGAHKRKEVVCQTNVH